MYVHKIIQQLTVQHTTGSPRLSDSGLVASVISSSMIECDVIQATDRITPDTEGQRGATVQIHTNTSDSVLFYLPTFDPSMAELGWAGLGW